MNLDQRNNSKLIWMITAGLVIILSLIAVFFWLNNTNSTTEQTKQSVKPVTQTVTPPVAQPLDTTAASTPITESHQTLVNESILKDEVPQNESLAKEEVARIDDIQKQLDEQAKILKSQHADADQLIKLKEEQIKLLEQQLSAQQNS